MDNRVEFYLPTNILAIVFGNVGLPLPFEVVKVMEELKMSYATVVKYNLVNYGFTNISSISENEAKFINDNETYLSNLQYPIGILCISTILDNIRNNYNMAVKFTIIKHFPILDDQDHSLSSPDRIIKSIGDSIRVKRKYNIFYTISNILQTLDRVNNPISQMQSCLWLRESILGNNVEMVEFLLNTGLYGSEYEDIKHIPDLAYIKGSSYIDKYTRFIGSKNEEQIYIRSILFRIAIHTKNIDKAKDVLSKDPSLSQQTFKIKNVTYTPKDVDQILN